MTTDAKTEKLPAPSFIQKAWRASLRTTLTLGVAAVAVFAVVIGSQELTRRAEAAPAPEPAPTILVETVPLVLEQGYEITRSFVGQIEAQRTASVSFELNGRLESVLVDEGQTVELGQHIATLDTRLLDAERDSLEARKSALEAQLRFATQTVERQSRLNTQGFASQAALDEALSRLDELSARISEVDAGLLTNAIQAEKSKVYAPFAGKVTERRVDGGESVAPGQTLVEIVENSAPHVRVGVPLEITENDLSASVIEIDGRARDASLVTLRPDVDPVTRTRTAIFEVQSDARVTFGQTARLRLNDLVESAGLWVPLTTLKEGLRGRWTLLAVDKDDTVRSLSVQVLHTDEDRVFVRGAFPDGVQLITAGPQRVTVGQIVDRQPTS